MLSARSPLGARLPAWGCLLALALVVLDAVSPSPRFALGLAALALLALSWRGSPRGLVVSIALAWSVQGAARLHLHLESELWPSRVQRRLESRLSRIDRRKQELVSALQSAAARAAALPEAQEALGGKPAARLRIFHRMETLREELPTLPTDPPQRPALALHAARSETGEEAAGRIIAWSGRIGDPPVPPGMAGESAEVFVLEGNVSTTLVALVPLPPSRTGNLRGFLTAALSLAARRNIRNEFLRDYDLLADADPGLEIRYVDARAGQQEAFPPLDPALVGREAVLRAPDGKPLAAARVTAPERARGRPDLESRYRRLLSLAVLVALGAWARGGARGRLPRWLLAMTAARAALLHLGAPLPGPESSLLSPEIYASDALSRISPALGPLLRSPVDLLLTGAWLVAMAGALARQAMRRPPAHVSLTRTALASVLSLPVLAAAFALVADTVANCSLDLEVVLLVPRGPAHLVLHVALLLVLGAAALAVIGLFARAGPWPADTRRRLAWLAVCLLPPFMALRLWSAHSAAPPVLAALTLYAVAATAGSGAAAIRKWMERTGAGAHAGLAIISTAVLAAVLFPALVTSTERNTRLQIERRYVGEVVDQPEIRSQVLGSVQQEIDALRLLEETPPGPRRPGLEELAFHAWSKSELALRGMSSAVEIQDASGALVSRFALNLPSLTPRPLPANENWKVSQEPLRLASTSREALHARRLLSYHGDIHGAVHVLVAEDYWNLPFLRGRDPYSELFRTRPARDRPVAFLSWHPDGRLAFHSTERPAALPAAAARLGHGSFWTRLELDGRMHEGYFFASPQGRHVLAFPLLGMGLYAANLVEAVAALTLLGLCAVLLVVLVRTLLGRPTLSVPSLVRAGGERFVRRLLVVFLVIAVSPVVVLQLLVSRFVSERLNQHFQEQARERAEVARKVALDYVRFRRAEEGPGTAITDAPLVWIADTIANDLDVFEQGRLVASSKRELYDAGLLPPRLSGAVYREAILEGEPFYSREERIGQFSYRVASVPLPVDEQTEPWILSLPLALPERDVAAAVADIERKVRLASFVFFALAALLAHSIARRISGPIVGLTEAARRIAQGDLAARVEPTSRDELSRLVEAFNQMADDLDRQRRDLERSNRLAAWAEMARQVAHEVKNPLTPIQLSAEHLRRVWRDRSADFGATLETCTQAILKQVRTLRGIVTEFSAFARPPVPAPEPLDARVLLAEVVGPYQAAAPPGVELRLETTAPVPPVLADRRLLERAVVNLLENALQAVGEHGTITVGAAWAEEAGQVRIAVTDSGPGLPADVRERVFEPFFSTKTSGSGLGLALVKKIAEDHGGGVRLDSEPGRGTSAILWLPAAPASALTAEGADRTTDERAEAAPGRGR